MAIQTKIGIIRDEIKRIGAYSPDVFKPGLDVFWHFSDMVVKGNRVESIPFELLYEVIKNIPDGAGEDAFWRAVDATDFDAFYDRLAREQQEEWEKAARLERRRLARLKGKKTRAGTDKKKRRVSKRDPGK